MAVKNTKLGGTDWVDGDILYAADQNDTFDAAVKPLISGTGNASGSTLLATFTAISGQFGGSEQIGIIWSQQNPTGSGHTSNFEVRVNDTSIFSLNADYDASGEMYFGVHPYDVSRCLGRYLYSKIASYSLAGAIINTDLTDNWITGAFTIKIYGSGSETSYFRWSVVRK